MFISITTHGPTCRRYHSEPFLWQIVVIGTAFIILSRLMWETFRRWNLSEMRFHWQPNNLYNSCRLLTAVLLWHAEVHHNGRQQHSRKLQSGWPHQLHASQNWNHGYGGQAGTTPEAAQTQTSRHERFNSFWLLMAVQKFHLSATSFLIFFPPWLLIYCSAFLSPPFSLLKPSSLWPSTTLPETSTQSCCFCNLLDMSSISEDATTLVHIVLEKAHRHASRCYFCSVGTKDMEMASRSTA